MISKICLSLSVYRIMDYCLHRGYPWLNYVFMHFFDLWSFVIIYEFLIVIKLLKGNSQLNISMHNSHMNPHILFICLNAPSAVHVSSRNLWLSLQWRHNGRDSVSNHQPHDCLPNGLFRRRSKKTWKLRVTGLCAGNSPGTGEYPAQMASNAENVSIWWRHHDASHACQIYNAVHANHRNPLLCLT